MRLQLIEGSRSTLQSVRYNPSFLRIILSMDAGVQSRLANRLSAAASNFETCKLAGQEVDEGKRFTDREVGQAMPGLSRWLERVRIGLPEEVLLAASCCRGMGLSRV